MSDIAIKVENLSKRYRIGRKEAVHDTLGGAMADFVRRPWQNWQQLRRLARFQEPGQEADDILWAIKDVSFEVKQGEVVGIIGRNGAGKSTLLKIISNITKPTGGRVTLYGRVASLLEVGTGFHPELTGRENVYLNGTILGMTKSEIDRKFAEIVDFAGVEKFIDTPVKRYSSGMQVRLAFSVAAHLEPEILLVDEVLAVGDVAFQQRSTKKMENISHQGRTVLFVSHNMAAVQRICQATTWLSSGGVHKTGQTHQVIQAYLSSAQSLSDIYSLEYQEEPDAPIQLQKVLLCQPQHGVFSISDSLRFEMDVLTRRLIKGAYITIHVLDASGTDVYWTSDIGSARYENSQIGCTTLICKFPSYLLTAGRYFASFGIVALGGGIIHHLSENRIIFTIEDKVSLLSVHGITQPGIAASPSHWSVISSNQTV